jgi:hypothetical protein
MRKKRDHIESNNDFNGRSHFEKKKLREEFDITKT